jgi:lipopolysaccharide O-acetyltransferase
MEIIRRYGFFGIIELFVFYLRTKFLFSKARLIRFPIDIRNRAQINIDAGFTTGRYCRLEAFSRGGAKSLKIGKNVQINDFVHITAVESVVIGDNVLIASKVYISDSSHGSYKGDGNDSNPATVPKDRLLFCKPIIIKENVWLGEFVSVLPGVTIGRGTVVGANSVVSKSLPDYVIAVGIPAKPIKKFDFQSQKWEKFI